MTFGEALEELKQGGKVARSGWNGKGMYLWLLPAAKVPAEWCKEPHLKALAEETGGIDCLPSIRMKTADNKVLTGWLASQSDMLSDDWQKVEVVEPPNTVSEIPDTIVKEAGRHPRHPHDRPPFAAKRPQGEGDDGAKAGRTGGRYGCTGQGGLQGGEGGG